MATEIAYLALGTTEEQRRGGVGQKPLNHSFYVRDRALQISQLSPVSSCHQVFIPFLLPRKRFTP